MTTNEASRQEGNDEPSKSERRAEWEGFEFRVPVPGSVRVENMSYGEDSDEHVYVVSVEGGIPFDCTCPAWEYHNPEGGCKHMKAVENRPAVTRAASTTTNGQQVATDGGQPVEDDTASANDTETEDTATFDPHQHVPDEIDTITADGIEQVHDHLSDDNAAEYAEASVEEQAAFLWEMVDRGVIDLNIN